MIKLEQLAVDFAQYNSSYCLDPEYSSSYNKTGIFVWTQRFSSTSKIFGEEQKYSITLNFPSIINFINTSTFFITQSTKGKNTRLHIVLIYMSSPSKDTLLSKRHSVVVEEHKLEFVSNDWIIVYH